MLLFSDTVGSNSRHFQRRPVITAASIDTFVEAAQSGAIINASSEVAWFGGHTIETAPD